MDETSAIARRRSEIGLTQTAAAERAGVSVATWRRFEQSPGLSFRRDTLRGVLRALRMSRDDLVRLLGAEQIPTAGGESKAWAKPWNELWADRFTLLTPRMAVAIQVALDMASDALESDLEHTHFDPADSPVLDEFDPRIFIAVGHNLTWYRVIGRRMRYLVDQMERGRMIDESYECFADVALFGAAVRSAAATWDDDESMDAWPDVDDDLADDLRDGRWRHFEDELDDLMPFREWDCVFPEYRKTRLLIDRRHPHMWFDEPEAELEAFLARAPYNLLAQDLVGPQYSGPEPRSTNDGSDQPTGARSSDEIEDTLVIPAHIAGPATRQADEQDARRGDWSSPRDAKQPEPPWPHQHNPMMRYLLLKAQVSMDAGMKPGDAMVLLAVHAWFEGGVEGYDRGQHDARRQHVTDLPST